MIIVGEQPSAADPNGTGGTLLGRSGRRLARLARLSWPEWLALDRRNLLPVYEPEWDLVAARAAAVRIRDEDTNAIVLCGERVQHAFGFVNAPPLSQYEVIDSGARVLLLPHPSGRNRWWNDEAQVEQAAGVFSWFVEQWAP